MPGRFAVRISWKSVEGALPRRADRASAHAPLMERARRAGAERTQPFREGEVRLWLWIGAVALVVLAYMPVQWPATSDLATRLGTILSMVFLVAAVGLKFRMGNRAFAVAWGVVSILYVATAVAGVALLEQRDFQVPAVLVSFGFFVLAGINVVFVLEEMVHDIHRELLSRRRFWVALPDLGLLAATVVLAILPPLGGPRLGGALGAGVLGVSALGLYWVVRAFRPMRQAILRELHLLAYGVFLASLLADGVRQLHNVSLLVPSVAAFLILVLTWLYVSYTAIQRAHFLLGGRDVLPWMAVLLSASHATVTHALGRFEAGGGRAVLELANQRTAYLVLGVWLGIAIYALQGVYGLVVRIRDERALGPSSRMVAARIARLVETSLALQGRVAAAAAGVLAGMDKVMPGRHHPPERHHERALEEELRRWRDEEE